MKMKMLAKNQNVRLTRCGPMMLSRKPYRPATSHSKRFCAPPGTCFMFRVATRVKMINPAVTIQVTTMELVIGKPKGRAISPAFLDRPCSSGSTMAAGKRPCSAFPWPATLFADVADPTWASSFRANVKSAPGIMNKAAKSSSGNPVFRPFHLPLPASLVKDDTSIRSIFTLDIATPLPNEKNE